MTPLKAIKQKCLECCFDSAHEVKLCPSEDCPLWAYRFGKNPNMKTRVITEEQKAQSAERLRKWRFENKAKS